MKENEVAITGQERRKEILKIIARQTKPISASALGNRFNVSRQVVVGDIALLRAQGDSILSTYRGYILESSVSQESDNNKYIGRIALQHAMDATAKELKIIINEGGKIVDVIIEHDIYGQLTGNLNIETQEDIDYFIKSLNKKSAKLLSNLTDGIHLHTVSTPSKTDFNNILKKLDKAGFLYKQD